MSSHTESNAMNTQNIDDGGPAFPVSQEVSQAHYGCSDGYLGMSLRDYPAIHTDVSGFVLTNGDIKHLTSYEMNEDFWTDPELPIRAKAEAIAKIRYMHADAMIAARNLNK